MSRNEIENILSKARLRISQKAKRTKDSTQIVNVNILLGEDKELLHLTKKVIDLSHRHEKSFMLITDFLRNVEVNELDPLEQSLVLNWLRKVVAANHIKLSKQSCGKSDFQLIMLDTSLYDQPKGSWLENKDFTKVVDFDGHLARLLKRKGNIRPVIRIFFVPDSKFIKDNDDYIKETIKNVN